MTTTTEPTSRERSAIDLNPRLDGQVALVTGAARGQGRSHALALAAAGADVAALDICADLDVPSYPMGTRAELDAVIAAIEDMDRLGIALVADVRSDDAVERAVATVMDTFGRIDILVNNAGVATSAPFWELTPPQWNAVVDINLSGVWRVSRAVAPHLRGAPRGRIVNVSSTAGKRAIADFAHYVAAKHGVIGLTKAMAIELAPDGVTVNVLLPGTVDSPMLDGLAEELGLTTADIHDQFLPLQLQPRVIPPWEVSATLLWLLSNGAAGITGQCIAVDGGSLAH